ncbi:MAG: protoheme IX farnesyltransferase [Acidobacteria bacterium]|nr:protoheme IX farnesyltransferase [Acidobacteriota bacterium]
MKHYLALTKPRITWLILVSTGVGYYFGASGPLQWIVLLHCMVGTALLASGTAALNQWYESDADAQMRRTEKRPIPAGVISPRNAFLFGLALSLIGFFELALGANWLTAGLGLFTELSYLCLYTPLKRRSPISTTVGAVPGAMPPLIGFAAARGVLTAEAWVLYAILFLWQFPHFYAIAWMYREDYSRGGIRMLPVVEPDGDSTVRQMLLFSLVLIPISLLPTWLSMAGAFYFVGALICGVAFVGACISMMGDRSLVKARGVLLASVIYLPVIYGLLVLDRTHL